MKTIHYLIFLVFLFSGCKSNDNFTARKYLPRTHQQAKPLAANIADLGIFSTSPSSFSSFDKRKTPSDLKIFPMDNRQVQEQLFQKAMHPEKARNEVWTQKICGETGNGKISIQKLIKDELNYASSKTDTLGENKENYVHSEAENKLGKVSFYLSLLGILSLLVGLTLLLIGLMLALSATNPAGGIILIFLAALATLMSTLMEIGAFVAGLVGIVNSSRKEYTTGSNQLAMTGMIISGLILALFLLLTIL